MKNMHKMILTILPTRTILCKQLTSKLEEFIQFAVFIYKTWLTKSPVLIDASVNDLHLI